MPQNIDPIRVDFDKIATLSDTGWDHNVHHHNYLLKQLPDKFGEALEIGCGTGEFSRVLAKRATNVLTLDLSPEMIRIAIERSAGYENIVYQVADAVERDMHQEKYDCIVSIATLHHLPIDTMLGKLKDALKPGGTILILDLYLANDFMGHITTAMALPVNIILRLIKTGRMREPVEVRRAWAEHEQHDSFPTLMQVKEICSTVLPGAVIKRHLLWRYSIVWKKP